MSTSNSYVDTVKKYHDWKFIEDAIMRLDVKSYALEEATASGETLMHIFAQNKKSKLLKLYLDCKPPSNFNAQDKRGKTALIVASEVNSPSCVKVLLQKNCDAKIVDKEGQNALHKACMKGHLDVVKILLESSDIDINAQDLQQRTALYLAASGGHHHILTTLVEKGAKISIPCKSGKNALHIAAKNGHVETVLAILKKANYETITKLDDQQHQPVEYALNDIIKTELQKASFLKMPFCSRVQNFLLILVLSIPFALLFPVLLIGTTVTNKMEKIIENLSMNWDKWKIITMIGLILVGGLVPVILVGLLMPIFSDPTYRQIVWRVIVALYCCVIMFIICIPLYKASRSKLYSIVRYPSHTMTWKFKNFIVLGSLAWEFWSFITFSMSEEIFNNDFVQTIIDLPLLKFMKFGLYYTRGIVAIAMVLYLCWYVLSGVVGVLLLVPRVKKLSKLFLWMGETIIFDFSSHWFIFFALSTLANTLFPTILSVLINVLVCQWDEEAGFFRMNGSDLACFGIEHSFYAVFSMQFLIIYVCGACIMQVLLEDPTKKETDVDIRFAPVFLMFDNVLKGAISIVQALADEEPFISFPFTFVVMFVYLLLVIFFGKMFKPKGHATPCTIPVINIIEISGIIGILWCLICGGVVEVMVGTIPNYKKYSWILSVGKYFNDLLTILQVLVVGWIILAVLTIIYIWATRAKRRAQIEDFRVSAEGIDWAMKPIVKPFDPLPAALKTTISDLYIAENDKDIYSITCIIGIQRAAHVYNVTSDGNFSLMYEFGLPSQVEHVWCNKSGVRAIATGTANGLMFEFDPTTKKTKLVCKIDQRNISAISGCGGRFCYSVDKTIFVSQIKTGKVITKFEIESENHSISQLYMKSVKEILCLAGDSVLWYKIKEKSKTSVSCSLVTRIKNPEGKNFLRFSCTQDKLACGTANARILLYDVEYPEKPNLIVDLPKLGFANEAEVEQNRHQAGVTGVFFIEQENMLISCSKDTTVLMWDFEANYKTINALKEHKREVQNLFVVTLGDWIPEQTADTPLIKNAVITWDEKGVICWIFKLKAQIASEEIQKAREKAEQKRLSSGEKSSSFVKFLEKVRYGSQKFLTSDIVLEEKSDEKTNQKSSSKKKLKKIAAAAGLSVSIKKSSSGKMKKSSTDPVLDREKESSGTHRRSSSAPGTMITDDDKEPSDIVRAKQKRKITLNTPTEKRESSPLYSILPSGSSKKSPGSPAKTGVGFKRDSKTNGKWSEITRVSSPLSRTSSIASDTSQKSPRSKSRSSSPVQVRPGSQVKAGSRPSSSSSPTKPRVSSPIARNAPKHKAKKANP